MHYKDRFDFDSIACPNSFEDDPEVDVFFDRKTRCSKQKTLCKTSVVKKDSAPKTQNISATESARKNIKKKAKSFREKFLPQRKPKPADVGRNDHNAPAPEQVTPVAQVLCKAPLEPPRTKRVGRSKEGLAADTPRQDCVRRPVLGRWSFPLANLLTYSVDPEDVKRAQTTPLRSKKDVIKGTKKSFDSTVTPKRKKSSVKATRIRFEPRDSLRRASLRKSIAKAPNPSRIPILRKPYMDMKSRMGEVFRSVLPGKPNPPASKTSVKTTEISREGNTQQPRSNYPAGKTLAQLVKEFQRCPRQYSEHKTKSKVTRAAWKTYF